MGINEKHEPSGRLWEGFGDNVRTNPDTVTVTVDEYRLLYWAAPTYRTGDDESDQHRARAASLAALPRVRRLIEALDERDKLDGLVADAERQQPGTVTLDKARASVQRAKADADRELAWALDAGLKARLGLQLGAVDARVFHFVKALRSDPYAPLPPRIAVCEGCAFVFKPSQKAHAAVCPFCDKRPHAAAPGSSSRNPDGSITFHSLVFGTYHAKTCATCHGPFHSDRSDAKFCSEACGKRFRRRGPDEKSEWERYMEECFGDRTELRAEFEAALEQASRVRIEQMMFRIREAVATRPGPALTREDALAERAAIGQNPDPLPKSG